MRKKKQFQKQYPWLKIFKPNSITDPNYHFFTRDVEGYQKVTLATKYGNNYKHTKMYFEIDNEIL